MSQGRNEIIFWYVLLSVILPNKMKWFNVVSAGLMVWTVVSATPTPGKPHEGEGSGPYPAVSF